MESNNYDAFKVTQHLEETKRLVNLLRETIDRRFHPDEVIEGALDNVDVELQMLTSSWNKVQGEICSHET